VTVDQLRLCCKLLGVPEKFLSDLDKVSLSIKLEHLATELKKCSIQFGTVLLKSREYEDTNRIRLAVDVFSRYVSRNKAEGFNSLALQEIARLQRLLEERNRPSRKTASSKQPRKLIGRKPGPRHGKKTGLK
jgi:hypothetical protein